MPATVKKENDCAATSLSAARLDRITPSPTKKRRREQEDLDDCKQTPSKRAKAHSWTPAQNKAFLEGQCESPRRKSKEKEYFDTAAFTAMIEAFPKDWLKLAERISAATPEDGVVTSEMCSNRFRTVRVRLMVSIRARSASASPKPC